MSALHRRGVVAVGAFAAVAVLGGAIIAARPGGGPAVAAAPAAAAPGGAPAQAHAPVTYAPIVERVSPAVVSVRITRAAAGGGGHGSQMPDLFRRFFDDEFLRRFEFGQRDRMPRQMPRRMPHMSHVGSGFIIDAGGHIVTNNHVVDGAADIKVVMTDGREFSARTVGRDPKTDLALLKIDAGGDLPHVAFGRSEDVRAGDRVLAIGSPFGLGNTVTEGIISARGRDIGSGPYDDFLQIDAPINRGNSGGPSFNLRGEVIGVNTSIISPSGSSAGIGFAVPSDLAREVVMQLQQAGKVERGWLGVSIQEVTDGLADGLGLDEPRGALVAEVMEGSPAARGGLLQGDVILDVDGERIDSMRELPRLIARIPAGTEARLTVLRGGSETSRTVTIGAMPGDGEEVVAAAARDGGSALGMTLAAVDDAARSRFELGRDVEGVVVTGVSDGGGAASGGLRPGDVIRKVHGRDVRTSGDVLAAVEAARDAGRKSVLMLLRRGGSDRYVALPVDRS